MAMKGNSSPGSHRAECKSLHRAECQMRKINFNPDYATFALVRSFGAMEPCVEWDHKKAPLRAK
jgi:hypothetical protein